MVSNFEIPERFLSKDYVEGGGGGEKKKKKVFYENPGGDYKQVCLFLGNDSTSFKEVTTSLRIRDGDLISLIRRRHFNICFSLRTEWKTFPLV